MKRGDEMRKVIRGSCNAYKAEHADRIIKRLNDEILRLTVENRKLKRRLNGNL